MAENNFSLATTLHAMLEAKKYTSIRDVFVTMNPADVAAVLEDKK